MKHVHPVSCQELAESMTGYLEDDLSDEDKALIEEHLAMCKGCENYLDQMVVTVRAISALEPGSAAGPTKERLLHLFRQWKQERGDC